jgi:hypothetical protein
MRRPQSEREAREWLAGRIGKKEMPDWLWQYLSDRGEIRDALQGGTEEGLETLLESVRGLLRLARKAQGLRRHDNRRSEPKPNQYMTAQEIKRESVFSAHLARLASNHRAVARFRKEALGGTLLSRTEAEGLLASPAPYLLSAQVFRDRAIPLLGHRAEAKCRRSTERNGAWTERVELKIKWQKSSARFRFTIARTIHDRTWLDVFSHLFGTMSPYPLMDYSLLGDLQKVSRSVAAFYPWQTWDAGWFILTGAIPSVPCIQPAFTRRQGDRFNRIVLTLGVEPWVSAKTVVRIYREYQRRLLGRDNRALGLKVLDVFEFVMKSREGSEQSATWEKLREQWNRKYPNWAYPDFRHLRADFERAKQDLIFPRYRQVF